MGPLVVGSEPENRRQARDAGDNAVLTDYPLTCRDIFREATVTHRVLAAGRSTGKAGECHE